MNSERLDMLLRDLSIETVSKVALHYWRVQVKVREKRAIMHIQWVVDKFVTLRTYPKVSNEAEKVACLRLAHSLSSLRKTRECKYEKRTRKVPTQEVI